MLSQVEKDLGNELYRRIKVAMRDCVDRCDEVGVPRKSTVSILIAVACAIAMEALKGSGVSKDNAMDMLSTGYDI